MSRKSSLVSLATVFALWLGIILGCTGTPQNRQAESGSSSSSSSSSPNPSASPIPITALALASVYDDNEVAADQQYEGKELLVTGKVESIATVFGSTYVTLKGKEMSLVSVQCFVDDSQKAAVAKLKKGTLATVQGTCDGKSMNVELKNCVIK